ncbi:hypothetical protein PHMEG_00026105 [Phytophthora megakarya]|uniref:Uncharacterized protein n=1 Tax=Phytophthora megakarya TaxID=4795 RepID=A0A225VAD5_9STRA|nr:hypothetical protein PHMEG_00026105 [Phytophthora megakarya]
MSPFYVDTDRVARSPGINVSARNYYATNFVEEHQPKARQKKYYDQLRSGVKFKAGDWVHLNTKNLPLAHVFAVPKLTRTS